MNKGLEEWDDFDYYSELESKLQEEKERKYADYEKSTDKIQNEKMNKTNNEPEIPKKEEYTTGIDPVNSVFEVFDSLNKSNISKKEVPKDIENSNKKHGYADDWYEKYARTIKVQKPFPSPNKSTQGMYKPTNANIKVVTGNTGIFSIDEPTFKEPPKIIAEVITYDYASKTIGRELIDMRGNKTFEGVYKENEFVFFRNEPKKNPISINKSEEVFVNYNELADGLAKSDLIKKYGESYDELETIDEYEALCEEYRKLILKYERNEG